MGITVATVRAAATIDVAPYTQDFTTADLGGLTPQAALFLVSEAVADGVAANDNVLSIGAATAAAEEWQVYISDQHNQGTTDTHRGSNTDRSIDIKNPGSAATNGRAEFTAFINNGVRVNWTTVPGAAFLVTVILFAGTDLSAHANSATLGNEDVEVNIEDPGFEPDVVLVFHHHDDADDNASNASWGAGVAHNDRAAGITQRSFTQFLTDGVATSSNGSYYHDSRAGCRCDNTGALTYSIELANFDANGFSAYQRDATAGFDFFYLALNFGSSSPVVDAWVGDYTTPTSTGDDAETGPGLTPQFVLMGMTMMEAVDTGYANGLAGSLGFSVFDDDDEYAQSWASEDNVATSNTQSLSDDTAVELPDDDGGAGLTASFSSFDANGFTLNYSTVEANAKYFWVLAIEEEAAAEPRRIFITHT